MVEKQTALPGRTVSHRRVPETADTAARRARLRTESPVRDYRPCSMVTTEPVTGDVVCVVVAGEFDVASANLIADAVTIVLDRGHRQLIIDLHGTTFLDCSALGALLTAVAPLRSEPETTVVLAGAHGIVARVLELVDVHRFLPVAIDRSSALEALLGVRLGRLAAS